MKEEVTISAPPLDSRAREQRSNIDSVSISSDISTFFFSTFSLLTAMIMCCIYAMIWHYHYSL